MEKRVKNVTFGKRLKSMLRVDGRRLFTTPLFYIMIGISVVVPILILVMTSMMDGMVSIDPQTGKETVMEGFKNVWQAIGSTSKDSATMRMDLTAMCNINMLYFFLAAFVCIFVADDFRSGYAKNLFTVRAKKTDYVLSKSLVATFVGACMLLGFLLGAMLGGKIAGLPFGLNGFRFHNLVFCMLSKIFLVPIFVSVFLLASVIAKQKLWLSILLSLGFGMLFYTVVPMVTPLDSGIVNVLLSLVGGVGFAVGMGAISNLVLKKTALI